MPWLAGSGDGFRLKNDHPAFDEFSQTRGIEDIPVPRPYHPLDVSSVDPCAQRGPGNAQHIPHFRCRDIGCTAPYRIDDPTTSLHGFCSFSWRLIPMCTGVSREFFRPRLNPEKSGYTFDRSLPRQVHTNLYNGNALNTRGTPWILAEMRFTVVESTSCGIGQIAIPLPPPCKSLLTKCLSSA